MFSDPQIVTPICHIPYILFFLNIVRNPNYKRDKEEHQDIQIMGIGDMDHFCDVPYDASKISTRESKNVYLEKYDLTLMLLSSDMMSKIRPNFDLNFRND